MAQLDIAAPVGMAEIRTPPRGALRSVLMLALTIANASTMRAVFSPMQELASRDLSFTDFQVSLIQGIAASIPIGLLALPVGRITDRGNRARLLLALSALWTLGTVGTVFAVDFWQMFLARMLAGAGAFCSLTVAISMVADLSAPEKRGRTMLFLSIGNMVGLALSFALGGALLGYFSQSVAPQIIPGLAPWRSVHLVFACVSVALTLMLLTLREPTRRDISDAGHTDFAAALGAIWERRALLGPLFLGQVTVVMADAAATIWAAPVLSRAYGLTPEQFGGWMGLVLLGSGIVGAVVGGVAADFGQKLRVRNGILIGAVAAAAISVPGALFPLMPSVLGFALLLTLLLLCGAVTGLITATAITVLVPNEIRGLCLGAFVVIGAIIGFGVAPTAVTLVSDALGGGNAIRYGLAGVSGITSAVAALGFLSAMRAKSP